MGESGSDVVHQVAKIARSAHLVVRRPRHIIPRMIYGDTNDSRTTRASHYSYLVSQSNFEASVKKIIFDRSLDRSGQPTPFSVWKYLVHYGFHGEFSNKNDVFFQDIAHGRLKLHLFGIERLEADAVLLQDGTRMKCSDLMLSTGYVTNFDLIDHPAATEAAHDVRNCLFHMIHPDLRESMAWIGFVRPDVGGVPAVAELQARYLSKLLARKLTLPNKDALQQDIDKLRSKEEFHFCLEPGISENVKYYHITNQLAEKLRVRPHWWNLVSRPRLMLNYYHGSMVAAQFRLVGPDRSTKAAREFISKVGLTRAPRVHVAFVVAVTSALSLAAPLLRRTLRKFGMEQRDARGERRYHTVAQILANQWPFAGRRTTDDSAPLRTLFTEDYEFEGFKYFLVKYYGIAARSFAKESLSIDDVNALLQQPHCRSSFHSEQEALTSERQFTT